MTRCCRDNINLKSSGQSYVDQLALHRSMCTHMRRVLLAKSVVDSRNPKYMQTMQNRYRLSSYKPRVLEECPSNETIDKLAYDTEHHPSEIIKVHCRNKISPKELSFRKDRQYLNNDINCPCLQLNLPKSKFKHQKRLEDFQCCRGWQGTKGMANKGRKFFHSKCECCSCRCTRPRSYDGACGRSMSPGDDSISPIVTQNKTTSSQYEERDDKSFVRFTEHGDEEARYAKFVYDITQEIVRNGLYTDQQLKEVFEKHLQRSSGLLNKRKMLYEIYQLKISLNVMDDSEEEDEVEADLVFAENFSKFRVPKPPTPPKILNENKILDKLQSFVQQQKIEEGNLSSSQGRKNVVLVDANPEFLVTERDVLFTLMEHQVNPEQIQRIYRHLFQRSKDMSLCEAVQVGKEVTYAHRLKQIDRGISAISLNNSVKERLHGILRNENTKDLAFKGVSSQTSYRSHDYTNNKRAQILDESKTYNPDKPCKKHDNHVKKEKQQSILKIPARETEYLDNQINITDQVDADNKTEKPRQRSNTIENRKTKGPLEISERSSGNSIGDKEDPRSNVDSSTTFIVVQSEENDEIEEDIESETEDLLDKSKKSSSVLTKGKSGNEENEENEDNDDCACTESCISHESLKYSDDFSNVSESSCKTDSNCRDNEDNESPLRVFTNKVEHRRYSSIKEYVEKLGVPHNKITWQNSSTSSESLLEQTKYPETAVDTQTKHPEQVNKNVNSLFRTIKKRTSWGITGLKAPNMWNEKISELSSDLYINPSYNYCNKECRPSVDDKSCSDNCKFVKTNCKNISKSTHCLHKIEENLESSDSSNGL